MLHKNEIPILEYDSENTAFAMELAFDAVVKI